MPQHPRTKLFIALLAIVAVALGYNYFEQPFEGRFNQPAPIAEEAAEPENPQLTPEMILESLSAEERIAQMLAVPVAISEEPAAATDSAATSSAAISNQTTTVPTPTWIEANNPGFLVVFGEEIRKSQATDSVENHLSSIKSRDYKLSPAIAVDHEGGTVQRLSGIGYTELPSWKDFCALDTIERLELLGRSAAELRSTGVNIIFAPVADTAASNGVLGSRICSGDYELVAARSEEAAGAYLAQGIMPVFKHFPGIGQVNVDLHRSFGSTVVSSESSELFRQLLANFPQAGVMITHVGVTNSVNSSEPCSLSEECVGALHKIFPNVLTFSDALGMRSAAYTPQGARTLPEISLQAVIAGEDVLVFDSGTSELELDEVKQALLEAYEADSVFADKVDASVRKILAYKYVNELVEKEIPNEQ